MPRILQSIGLPAILPQSYSPFSKSPLLIELNSVYARLQRVSIIILVIWKIISKLCQGEARACYIGVSRIIPFYCIDGLLKLPTCMVRASSATIDRLPK